MTANIKKTAGRIEVLHDTEIIIGTYMHILHKADRRWDYFADVRSLSVIPFGFDSIKKDHNDTRWIRSKKSTYDIEHIEQCKRGPRERDGLVITFIAEVVNMDENFWRKEYSKDGNRLKRKHVNPILEGVSIKT